MSTSNLIGLYQTRATFKKVLFPQNISLLKSQTTHSQLTRNTKLGSFILYSLSLFYWRPFYCDQTNPINLLKLYTCVIQIMPIVLFLFPFSSLVRQWSSLKKSWRRDLYPQTSDLIHGALDHRTTMSCLEFQTLLKITCVTLCYS